MSEPVDITFSAVTGDHVPGERRSLPAHEAKRFVQAGVATYSTKAAAKAAGVDQDAAASKR